MARVLLDFEGTLGAFNERTLVKTLNYVVLTAFAALGCDDTAEAIDARAEHERAELRAEVEKLKADLKSAEDRIEARAEQFERRAEQAAQEAKAAAQQTAESGAEAVQEMGSRIERRVDAADKAVADEIRD